MRLIDGDNLYAVLENIANHLLETKSETKCGMAHAIEYVMEVVRAQPTISPPPNDPLTLEELLEMDGEPVWVINSSAKRKDGFCDEWALISVMRRDAESVGTIYHFENYGDYWFAHRRKPEEGTM